MQISALLLKIAIITTIITIITIIITIITIIITIIIIIIRLLGESLLCSSPVLLKPALLPLGLHL